MKKNKIHILYKVQKRNILRFYNINISKAYLKKKIQMTESSLAFKYRIRIRNVLLELIKLSEEKN